MSTDSKHKIPVICLFGPTAVGKTAVLPFFSDTCEVINADSMQVYKYMNIGTAKPDKKTLAAIPHHLVDIITPDVQFNAGKFVEQADDLCREIINRKKIPLISGGTAFYFINFIMGLPEAPPSNLKIKNELVRRCGEQGTGPLHDELKKIDPVTAERLPLNDKQRIIRALEIYKASGKPLSEYSTGKGRFDRYNFCILGLKQDRAELYENINARVELMFKAGLVEEVKTLVDMGYSFDDPGMKGIGYREFREVKDFCLIDKEHLIKEIAKNTRRYAKRQITFFRKITNTIWIDSADTESVRAEAAKFIAENSL